MGLKEEIQYVYVFDQSMKLDKDPTSDFYLISIIMNEELMYI